MNRAPHRGRGSVACAVVVALLLAACTGGEPAGGPTSDTGPAEPSEALLALGELLDDEGRLPLDVAQQVFAAEVAPLPGVEPLELPEGGAHDLAGAAVRRVLGAQAELPPDVAAAAVAALEPAEGEEEVVVEPGRAREGDTSGTVDPGDVPTRAELAEQVAAIIADLEARSGHDLRLPVRARTVAHMEDLGVATGVWTGDRVTACRVAIKEANYGLDAESALSTLAHEIWHCFQYDVDAHATGTAPLWMIEGSAEWAGEEYAGGSPSSAGRWDTWLFLPEQALPRRSYDAIGLYALAQASGADVWATGLAMLGQGTDDAVVTLFGGTAPAEVVRAHAMAMVREPSLGDEWESSGPGITNTRTEMLLAVTEASAGEVSLDLGRYGALPVRLRLDANLVVEVRVIGGTAGALEVGGTGTVPLVPGAAVRLCTDAAECVCPDGSPIPGVIPAAAGQGVAALGAVEAGRAVIRGEAISVEDACDGSLVGSWTAPVEEVWPALIGPYGGSASTMPCTGTYLLTFAQGGGFEGTYDATCTLLERSGHGTALFTGTWTDGGTTFTLSGLSGTGTLTIEDSLTMELPGVNEMATAMQRTSGYVVEGDLLAVTYTTPDGRAISVTYTRVP